MSVTPPARRSLLAALGPGLIFAGAAVGVSHLVQSTRAGATYGLSLVAFVLVANLVKYPAFRFGAHYASASGVSLLEGYRRQGRPALVLYLLLTLATMWTVQAAVTVVTAGLLIHITGLSVSPIIASAALLVFCGALLGVGQYKWLDRVTKVAVAIFTVATLMATIMAVPKLSDVSLWPDFGAWSVPDVLFVAALIGWMPSAIDVSVWQSLWTLAKAKERGTLSYRDSMLDFHIGYGGTVMLALCFVILGAAVLSGQELEGGAGAFGAQLVQLYADTLGGWSRPLIATAALLVMFSTTLTVLDGFPRALSVLVERFAEPETPFEERTEGAKSRRAYWIAMLLLACGSLGVLAFALSSLKAMVDLATTLSFLTAPILSLLNHRAMTQTPFHGEGRPSKRLLQASLAGVAIQGAFALCYLWLKVTAS
ncbi:MAG: NRAMP family divalent metal transporter [Polyangiales bacterium]